MEINELLLKTAFACMSCDGDIAPEEIELIKNMFHGKKLFGDIDIDKRLKEFANEINVKGKEFLKNYLNILKEATLTEEEEIDIANVAIQTIRIDNQIMYSEIKFFKIIRSNLKSVSDETLLEKIDGIDENYLAQDIRNDYIYIYDDYFNSVEITKFNNIQTILENGKEQRQQQ